MMKMTMKSVQFDYFQVWCHKEDNDSNNKVEKKYDLTGILEKALLIEPKETTYDFRGEKARLQKVAYDEAAKVWEIQLLRLREIAPPVLAKDDGSYEIFKLEDGEYIGESVSALYDSENYVLVLQRNNSAIPPSGVEEYLMKSINNKHTIKLLPILIDSSIDKITKNKVYRKLVIGLTTKEDEQYGSSSALGTILRAFNKYEGTNVKVEISVGHAKRDKSLSPGLVSETVNELYDSSKTSHLKVSARDVDDTRVEKIDLFDDRRKDVETLEVHRDMPLTHDRVYPILKSKYLTRKQESTIF